MLPLGIPAVVTLASLGERAGAERFDQHGPGSDHGEDADQEKERAPLLRNQHVTGTFVVILNITNRFMC